jgi:hypothetical protein
VALSMGTSVANSVLDGRSKHYNIYI